MKLLYYDEVTPADYQPPFFQDAAAAGVLGYEAEPVNLQIGTIGTRHHVLNVKVPAAARAAVRVPHTCTTQVKTTAENFSDGAERAPDTDPAARGFFAAEASDSERVRAPLLATDTERVRAFSDDDSDGAAPRATPLALRPPVAALRPVAASAPPNLLTAAEAPVPTEQEQGRVAVQAAAERLYRSAAAAVMLHDAVPCSLGPPPHTVRR
jgi:hypothetical protein